jgi:demethylmenaquinone methyltransferase / 2-methoxy-6-polyprenyl-1,4-benzoquinol methylase
LKGQDRKASHTDLRKRFGVTAPRYDLGKVLGARLHRRRKAQVAELARVFASEDERVSYARGMFGAIAPRYDLTNTVISAGLHRRWKHHTAALARVFPGDRAVDICCGTGDLMLLLAQRVGPEGRVVGIDLSEEMLRVARHKASAAGLGSSCRLVVGNAEALALPDESFDAATIGFGIRNTVHPEAVLHEVLRVLRPGGRLVVLEFGHPRGQLMRRLYDLYSFTLMPWLGRLISRHGDGYLYLPTSIRSWPDQQGFATMMAQAGFAPVEYRNLLAGIAAVHVGVRPSGQSPGARP